MCENDSTLSLIQHDGKRHSFTADSDMEEIAECLGLMCRDALEQARKKGLFKKLPLAADCRLAVEDHDGNYGWIEGGSEEEDEDEDIDESEED